MSTTLRFKADWVIVARVVVYVLSYAILTIAWLSCANAEDDKLVPLKYKHPGLEVDLGVGLWAYPLPMDYDNDGDLDLVVSCPDKPSNGTYLFENPTQDPSTKMPVFKPGVRLGKGHHYMMLSHVDGEPVVLRPAQVYRRDSVTQRFDFNRSTKIDGVMSNPNAITHGRTRGNMWRYVDYDGDGDLDIVVGSGDWTDLGWDHAYNNEGTWRNGPLHGFLYLIENEKSKGSDSPKYSSRPVRIQADGKDVDVYGWPCHNFKDFDGDGDLDILTGNFLDQFTYFENTGSRTSPQYAAGVLLDDDAEQPLVMNLQMITPTAIDWDRDGDIDLVVGDEDGRVALVENTGELRKRRPVFKSPVYFRQQADTLKFGALATPYAFDWDGDGDEDIVCGNTAGNIGLFENLSGKAQGQEGERGLPQWAAPVLLSIEGEDGYPEPFRIMAGENGSIQGPCEAKWGYTTLSVADWDGDGDGDIVYNSILARVGLLIHQSGTEESAGKPGILVPTSFDTGLMESPPVWYPWWRASASTLTQWRTTPVVIDYDADGALDLVLLDQEGYLTLRRSCGTAERVFVDPKGRSIRLNPGTAGRSGRVKLAVCDWDSDGKIDVLVNSENVTWYRNLGEHQGKVVLMRVGNLSTRNVAGHTASPAVCDFNQDGVPDMMIGSENGRIYHIFHDDCVDFTKQQMTATVQFEAIPNDALEPPAAMKEARVTRMLDTTRGKVAIWVMPHKDEVSDKSQSTSEVVRFAYHDGNRWSGPQAIHYPWQGDSIVTCDRLSVTKSLADETLTASFEIRGADGTIQIVESESYDRGRTFRPGRLIE